MRVKIIFACSECQRRNYNSKKDKRKHPGRMAFRKYCPYCNAHKVHRETK